MDADVATAQPHAPLAPWGHRAAATLLDAAIILGAGLVAGIFVGASWMLGQTPAMVVTGIVSLGFIAFALCYSPVLMARGGERNGQTLGKQALGIRARRTCHTPFGFGRAFLREFVTKNLLFGVAGVLLLYLPTLLDSLWPVWDERNRSLHDMVTSTSVVRA